MTFGNFWVGISKQIEENSLLLCRGGAFMGVWLSGQNGQDTNLGNFALVYFEKGQNFEKMSL